MLPASRKAVGLAVRVLITGLVFAYLFWRADLAQVVTAIRRIPASASLVALSALATSIVAGVARWRALLTAYGAAPSRWRDLGRWYLLAGFYNLLPGGIGGDVLRGYQTRALFDDRGAVRSLSVVFVERVLGFAGLLALAGVASLAQPAVRAEILLYAALGMAAAIAAVLAVAQGRRLARSLPSRAAKLFDDLPRIRHLGPFALAAALSVASQLCTAAAGHFLIASLASVRWSDSLVIFPIATLAAFFPLTVAGAGARDTALVFLLGRIGVPNADALAASLALLACHLTIAALGAFVRAPQAGELAADRAANPRP